MDLYNYKDFTYFTIFDILSRQTWILLVDNKIETEVASIFKAWLQSIRPEFQMKYSKLLSDRGGELNFETLCQEHIRTTAKYPQNNDLIEKKHREISQQVGIHEFQLHNLPSRWLLAYKLTILVVGYVPNERRFSVDDAWTFVDWETLLYA